MPFTHQLRVRFGECDPQNLVFNAHYLAYADVALTELQRAAFGSYEAMIAEHGVDLVVAQAQISFRAPARFDDLLDVGLTVARIGTTSMTLALSITRDATTIVEGDLRYVFVDAQTWDKAPIPDGVRAALALWAS